MEMENTYNAGKNVLYYLWFNNNHFKIKIIIAFLFKFPVLFSWQSFCVMICMSYLDQMTNLCGVGTLEQDKLLLHLMNTRYFTMIDRHDHFSYGHCL